MHENTPDKILQWVPALLGHVPDQAIVFENRSPGDAMYVVKVIDGSTTEGGLYETNKPCAEYLEVISFAGPYNPKCVPTFEFLVLRRGECYLPHFCTLLLQWHLIKGKGAG